MEPLPELVKLTVPCREQRLCALVSLVSQIIDFMYGTCLSICNQIKFNTTCSATDISNFAMYHTSEGVNSKCIDQTAPLIPCNKTRVSHLNLNMSQHIRFWNLFISMQGIDRALKELRTLKGDYCNKQRLSLIVFLIKTGTSLIEKNLLLIQERITI